MKECVIFCAGAFDGLHFPIPQDALVIAADGGLRHTQTLGIQPDVILGDFDSLGYVPKDARVYPMEKDDTDAMLAVRLGLQRGCDRFYLYGALDGPRLDHSMANFQTLAYLTRAGARGYLLGLRSVATVLCRESLGFSETARGIVSLFCLGSPMEVSIQGLKYPLHKHLLTPDYPLGVSNHFLGTPCRITAGDGNLLALWDRENGLGIRRMTTND